MFKSVEAGVPLKQNQRKAPKRCSSGAWKHFDVTEELGKLYVSCKFCGYGPFRVASQTRAVDHLLGRGGIKACSADTDAFFAAFEEVQARESKKDDQKGRKRKLHEVDRMSREGVEWSAGSSSQAIQLDGPPPADKYKQTPLVMARPTSAAAATDALARFFYGNNISTRVVESASFKQMVQAIRTAPLTWQPPTRKRLGGQCLVELVHTLRKEEEPMRTSVMRHGATVLSDGWDTIDRHHLINQLVGTSEGVFFDGTVQLSALDHENAEFVAEVFAAVIHRTGPFAVVNL